MDYVKPADVVKAMLATAERKLALAPVDLLVRGMMSGALLGFATSLAFNGAISTGQPLVGAIIFPVGLVMIVLLGLELVTGSFGLLALLGIERRASASSVIGNWSWVFVGNLVGSVVYGGLLAVTLTNFGHGDGGAVAQKLIAAAEAKTIANAAMGPAGMVSVFVKAILCNWMVCLAVVAAMSSTSTIGKIVCAWLPITVFFAQGFEHSVVNMFVIPTGMLLGAHVSLGDWWLWNQIPVTLGNIVGGTIFCCFPLYLTYKERRQTDLSLESSQVPAE
jgi:formate/nitrite transporter